MFIVDESTEKQIFEVTITETLCMTVEVEADNPMEAEQIVADRWSNSDYLLDADSFTGVEFQAHMSDSTKNERF